MEPFHVDEQNKRLKLKWSAEQAAVVGAHVLVASALAWSLYTVHSYSAHNCTCMNRGNGLDRVL